jgi:hypothetical protein
LNPDLDSKEVLKMERVMRLMDSLERMMAAVAFAEAGCWDTARTILNKKRRASLRRPAERKRASEQQRPVLRV